MTACATYQKSMYDHLGFFAMWLPGDRVELGDIGVLNRGRFHKENSLEELGVKKVAGPPGIPRVVSYHALSSSNVSAHGEGGLAAAGRGLLSVSFSAAGGFMFHAIGLRDRRLEERQTLNTEVVRMHKAGLWRNRNWLLIDGVYTADSATVLVSEEEAGTIVLEASADSLAMQPLQLGDAKAGLSVKSESGSIIKVLGGRSVNLLYTCMRLKTSFWTDASLVRGGADDSEHAPMAGGGDDPFISASIAELLG